MQQPVETAVNPQYNQLSQRLATCEHTQQIMVVQHPLGTALGHSSKKQAVEFEYNSIKQACCCCSFRFWALFMWIFNLIGSIILIFAAAIYVFIFATCKTLEAQIDDDSGTNATSIDDDAEAAVDTVCSFGLLISCIVLVAGLSELICVSIIIHGIRKFNYSICIFGCVFSVINIFASFASFAGVQNFAQESIASVVASLLTAIFTACHTYYLKQANQKFVSSAMVINSQ
jgi:hypothetical protein